MLQFMYIFRVATDKECGNMQIKDKVKELIKRPAKSRVFIFFLLVFLLVVSVRTFVIEPIQVYGDSMLPSFRDKDYIFIEKITYKKKDPERNDIVVIEVDDGSDTRYIKRIIGLPGETVQVKKGRVYIDGKALEENKPFPTIEDGGMARNKITLGKDEYFLLGDNRNQSKDSRHVEIGIVMKKQIKGKFWVRFFPFDRAE